MPDPVENYMDILFKDALRAGISPSEYWDNTPNEIICAVTVEKQKQDEFIKMLAWIVYNGAALTAVGVNDPKSFPSLQQAFPSLFEQTEQQHWQIIKARVENYASHQRSLHNK